MWTKQSSVRVPRALAYELMRSAVGRPKAGRCIGAEQSANLTAWLLAAAAVELGLAAAAAGALRGCRQAIVVSSQRF